MAKAFAAGWLQLTIIGIKEVMKILLRNRSSAKGLSLFLRQLELIMQSGLPLLRALELLAQQQNGRQQLLCLRLERCLRRGSSLAAAMELEAPFFPDLVVRLVAAGEESGELCSILEQLADYYARQAALESFVKQAVLYPALLMTVSLLLLLFFGVYVLPILAEAYLAMGVQPVGGFALLLEAKQLLAQSLWLSCAGTLGAACVVVKLLAWLWQRFLRSSWSGNFHGLLLEVRFCKLLALLLDSGLVITQAVAIIVEAAEDEAYARQLQLLNSRLQRGIAMEESVGSVGGVFSPLLLELVYVGAATGSLPKLLEQAAVSGQQRLEEQLGRFRQLLVPCLLLLLAFFVGSIICTILQPLFTMLATLPE